MGTDGFLRRSRLRTLPIRSAPQPRKFIRPKWLLDLRLSGIDCALYRGASLSPARRILECGDSLPKYAYNAVQETTAQKWWPSSGAKTGVTMP